MNASGRRPLSQSPVDSEERFADEFAMNLLMPERKVRRLYREGGGWLQMIVRFGVPAEVAIRRLRDLELTVRT